MMLHELATNALKYGALSVPSGSVDIAWTVEGDRADSRLALVWTERGGPMVAPPTSRGFGSELIERSIAYELNGKAALDFRVTGLRCTLDVPFDPEALSLDPAERKRAGD
jgi:two-component system CheB/CheR fusion protein